jgi:tripartite ATP-independent transporter DctM subunit
MSAGAIVAGGSLGILIPPSVMLIVMGPVLGVPVNHLYAAVIGPALLLTVLYSAYCLVRSFINPRLGPPLPKEERAVSLTALAYEVVVGVAPLLALIAVTLGTILMGLATATEAAACGAFGAILLAVCYRKFSLKGLENAARSALLTSCMVLFLAVAASVFGAVFTQLGTSAFIAKSMAAIPLPDVGKLILIMALIFLLGWPFEWPAIVLVFVPIFLPIVTELNLGLSKAELLLWFGAAIAVNLQTSFLSPPVAMAAFYLKKVMPEWTLGSVIFRGMLQFMFIQIFALFLLIMFPKIVFWVPRMLQP